MINDYPFTEDQAEYNRIVEDARRLRSKKEHQQTLLMLKALARQI